MNAELRSRAGLKGFWQVAIANGVLIGLAYYIAIYDWSLYTLPVSIPIADIEGNTHSNDPLAPGYSATIPSWIGETFTFNGGSSTRVEITDDDDLFEGGYVETGGAQTLSQDIIINGTTYLAGAVIENEFSMVDASGNEVFIVRIDGVNVGFGYPVGQEPTIGTGFTGTIGRDGDPLDSGDGVSSSSEPYANIVCFAEGTLILTPEGERSVESLKSGDQVMTLDRGAQIIRWTHRDAHTLEEVSADDKPVLIKAEALGVGLPAHDLIVSPQHRILVGQHRQLAQIFTNEALVPAKSLTSLPGIRHMRGKDAITWVHFACDRHEVVVANGCLSESLLLGPMVVNRMAQGERQAVAEIFGSPPTPDGALNGPPARVCLTVSVVRKLLANACSEKRKRTVRGINRWDADLVIEQYDAERWRCGASYGGIASFAPDGSEQYRMD